MLLPGSAQLGKTKGHKGPDKSPQPHAGWGSTTKGVQPRLPYQVRDSSPAPAALVETVFPKNNYKVITCCFSFHRLLVLPGAHEGAVIMHTVL